MAVLTHTQNPALVKCLGGPDYLADLQKRAAALQLPPCPFCGGSAHVHIALLGQAPKCAICCTSCRATTSVEPSRPCMTISEALTTVAAYWNRRH